MILGIGTDIIESLRIRKLYKRFPRALYKKILSPIELTKYEALVHEDKKIKFLTSRWAAKEALVKALGTGFRSGLYLRAFSVENNHLGQPQFILSVNSQTIIQKIFNTDKIKIHLTLSDEVNYTVAFVILEKI